MIVPDNAVVRSGERAWVYKQTGDSNFARREITANRPVAGGWFVTNGVAADDRVVVTGAQDIALGRAQNRNQGGRLGFIRMLNRIVQFSLRHRGVIMVLGVILIAYGLYIATQTRVDVFPEFAPPQIIIQTEGPGLSSEEVE